MGILRSDREEYYDLSLEEKLEHYIVNMLCYCHSLSILKYLVSHGADINQVRDDSVSPIWAASFHDHLSIVKYLDHMKQMLIK